MTPQPIPQFDSGYRCETGPVRQRNEDSCLTLTAEFGGHFDLRPLGPVSYTHLDVYKRQARSRNRSSSAT